jgi:hypothetical protein
MINFFSKFSFVLSQKRRFFRKNFRRKYFKNHNIGPRWQPQFRVLPGKVGEYYIQQFLTPQLTKEAPVSYTDPSVYTYPDHGRLGGVSRWKCVRFSHFKYQLVDSQLPVLFCY